MPAILYEIVPAARGKKFDKELSTLLYEAVKAHESTQVDATTEAGKMFELARPTHVRKAIALAEELVRPGP